MSILWISMLVAAGALVLALASWRHRVDMAELGSVSEHWLAENRTNDRHSSAR